MKNLKRALIFQFLFLFILPTTFADISMTIPEKEVYNLGERISADVSIKGEQDYDGFFGMSIICDGYNLQYYKIPLSLEVGFRTQLTVPYLSLSESMIGNCRLKSDFEADDGGSIVVADSNDFLVTDKLKISMDEILESKPGEDVVIFGEMRRASNEIFKKGELNINFKGKEYKANFTSGEFEYTIPLAEDAEAGIVPIVVTVKDQYGNYGNKILSLRVSSVAARIENSFWNDILIPGDNLKAQIILYDHGGDIMGGNIGVRIFGPGEELIVEEEVKSSDNFEFIIEKDLVPGDYFLLSEFEDIKKRDNFIIDVFRKIIMEQEGNLVRIENVGNVDYEDEVSITLKSDGRDYLITKNIDLGLGEKTIIDVSKDVPQGIYDIVLPEEAVEVDETVDEGSENVGDMAQKNVIKDVSIEDNRDVMKKTTGRISSITGAVAGMADYVASRPTLAAFILIFIILGTVMRYSWSFIKNKIKGKKDETEHIFEDFKFDEDEDSKPGD